MRLKLGDNKMLKASNCTMIVYFYLSLDLTKNWTLRHAVSQLKCKTQLAGSERDQYKIVLVLMG